MTADLNLFSLAGRKALVTGANSGIGQAIAVELARAGAHVLVGARSNADETLEMVAAAGGKAELYRLDLTDPMAGAKAFGSDTALQGVDILVNNAGIIRRSPATDFAESDWDDVVNVNMKAAFFTCQGFAKAHLAARANAGAPQRASVVNIASLLSFQGGINVVSYTAAKHGLAGVTKILANEWAAKNINVNAIAPGYIATANTAPLRADVERNTAILGRIPAGRWGDPRDIAGTAVFLSSQAAAYVHGAVLNVDGGWLAR